MTIDAPDYVDSIQININAGQPLSERAAGDTGSYTGVEEVDYQEVALWTVADGYVGELKEIIILSSDYAKTLVQITIGDITYCTDWTPQACIPLIFEDLRLAEGAIVKVETLSSDGTSITVDAVIVGKEVG